jgi:hypothetical protein
VRLKRVSHDIQVDLAKVESEGGAKRKGRAVQGADWRDTPTMSEEEARWATADLDVGGHRGEI